MKNHSVLVNNHFSSSQERPSPRSEQMKVNIEPIFLHEAQNCLYLKDNFKRERSSRGEKNDQPGLESGGGGGGGGGGIKNKEGQAVLKHNIFCFFFFI